jgi:hypothetical protein
VCLTNLEVTLHRFAMTQTSQEFQVSVTHTTFAAMFLSVGTMSFMGASDIHVATRFNGNAEGCACSRVKLEAFEGSRVRLPRRF